jgi:hypothetical protein
MKARELQVESAAGAHPTKTALNGRTMFDEWRVSDRIDRPDQHFYCQTVRLLSSSTMATIRALY